MLNRFLVLFYLLASLSSMAVNYNLTEKQQSDLDQFWVDLTQVIGRKLVPGEEEYLTRLGLESPDVLKSLLEHIRQLTDNETMSKATFLFHFFLSSDQAENLRILKNAINIFLVRVSYEDGEWKTVVSMKSTRSQGKMLHTSYIPLEGYKICDRNIIGSLQLIDSSWAIKMVVVDANSLTYSIVHAGLITGNNK